VEQIMADQDETSASIASHAIPDAGDLESPVAADPETLELDREIARTRARMIERLQELDRRIGKAKAALNVAELIRKHPLAATGLSAAAGALIAMSRGGSAR
jgi:ElaB/YqjD/DUF883 family membrane-anchored ribosome-binding protein